MAVSDCALRARNAFLSFPKIPSMQLYATATGAGSCICSDRLTKGTEKRPSGSNWEGSGETRDLLPASHLKPIVLMPLWKLILKEEILSIHFCLLTLYNAWGDRKDSAVQRVHRKPGSYLGLEENLNNVASSIGAHCQQSHRRGLRSSLSVRTWRNPQC